MDIEKQSENKAAFSMSQSSNILASFPPEKRKSRFIRGFLFLVSVGCENPLP